MKTIPVRVPLRIGALALLLLGLLGLPTEAGPSGVGKAWVGHLQGASLRYGLLWLDIDPNGSHITLDGEFLDSGVWLISMAPGLHDIAVRKDGFMPWSRRIGIGPGESLKLSVRLEPFAGK